ncbi:hypothetical protein KYB31_12320 [Clostridium felsineum]|uniref:hypothetical protein n=1 Tax=Clostridium felsineum TaxID=36839 RepID=UPI00214D90C1|nr:hypothetical protein [Clostridium felsineum]MCR3759759.1 hypothetical protein [Clostridium felsineum]
MDIKIGVGIEEVLFGMKQEDVIEILGKPDKINYEEKEEGIVYYYNDKMIKLKFDKSDHYKLYSIEVCYQEIIMFNENIFNKLMCEVEDLLKKNGYFKFEYEDYEFFNTLFSEEIWTTFTFEFNKLMSIEFSPLFNEKDERIWPIN